MRKREGDRVWLEAEWGLSDGLFVDGKRVMTGPPISPDRLRKIVRKRLARV